MFVGKLHSEGGIPVVVKDSGQPIEVERDEPLIPREALDNKKVKKRQGTNLEIIHQINKENGAKGMNEVATEVYSGDAIICRKSAYDKKKRTYIGTDKQIVSAINQSNGCKVIEKGAKAVDEKGIVVQYKKGGLAKEEAEIAKRWSKKKSNIQELANNIHRLRLNLTRDLKSDNEKIFLTALVISVMERTAERVGNDDSADNGHYGVTGFRKKHLKIDGNKIKFEYIGKSGVEHEKTIIDSKLAPLLSKAIKNGKGYYVFTTSDGFRIKADRVNRYLSDFNITAKDLRGYNANKWIIDKLKKEEIDSDSSKRKTLFNKIVKKVSLKVGHGSATLKKHYMIPELSHYYIEKGKIIDMKDLGYYKEGGEIDCGCNKPVKKMENGGSVLAEELFITENIENNLIPYDKLKSILGKDPDYPVQMVGSLKLRKCFLRPFYQLV